MKKAFPIIIIMLILAIFLLPNLLKTAQSQKGQLGIGATIHYKDGTTETVDPLANGPKLFPLTVTFEDNPLPIIQVDFTLYATVNYEGTLESLYIQSLMQFDLQGDGVYEKTETREGPYPLTTMPLSGSSFVLGELSVTATQLETWAGGAGTYLSVVQGRGSVGALFTDGREDFLESDGWVTSEFKFEISLTGFTSALTIYIGAMPWREPPESK